MASKWKSQDKIVQSTDTSHKIKFDIFTECGMLAVFEVKRSKSAGGIATDSHNNTDMAAKRVLGL